MQALSSARRAVNALRKEQVRLQQKLGQAAAPRVGPEAAAAALEAVCTQLEFVRGLRERHTMQLQLDIDRYNLVRLSFASSIHSRTILLIMIYTGV